jgi:hypothetical protein
MDLMQHARWDGTLCEVALATLLAQYAPWVPAQQVEEVVRQSRRALMRQASTGGSLGLALSSAVALICAGTHAPRAASAICAQPGLLALHAQVALVTDQPEGDLAVTAVKVITHACIMHGRQQALPRLHELVEAIT